MFKVISDIMAHCYEWINTVIITINFCNAKKINCAIIYIINNHYGRKCFSNLLQLERCNDMFRVLSDIMAHWYK